MNLYNLVLRMVDQINHIKLHMFRDKWDIEYFGLVIIFTIIFLIQICTIQVCVNITAAATLRALPAYMTRSNYIEHIIWLFATMDVSKVTHHAEAVAKCPTIRLGVCDECFFI